MKRVAIFASGSGTNAQQIAEYFKANNAADVAMILTNNPTAYVIKRARKLGIPCKIFNKKQLAETGEVLTWLSEANIDLVVLAGFLWLMPEQIIKAYPEKIVNIHPALLPKFGGKGMYGSRVHQAVIDAGETESGITIHLVDEAYDRGKIIFQAKCEVTGDDTAESLAAKIHQLEYAHFPVIIHQLLNEVIR